MTRVPLLLVSLLAVVLAAAGSASAARPTLTLTPSSVRAGHTVTIHGNAGGCPVGDTVTLISRAFAATHEFAGMPAVFARVRSNGLYAVTTRIPRTRGPGRYVVTARCGGGNFGIAGYLVVR